MIDGEVRGKNKRRRRGEEEKRRGVKGREITGNGHDS